MTSLVSLPSNQSDSIDDFHIMHAQEAGSPFQSEANAEDHVHAAVTSVLNNVDLSRFQETPLPFQGALLRDSASLPQKEEKERGSSSCGLLQVVSLVVAFISAFFLAFSLCYGAGFFRFEAFLGPVGSTVFPSTGGALVMLSGILLYCSFRSNT